MTVKISKNLSKGETIYFSSFELCFDQETPRDNVINKINLIKDKNSLIIGYQPLRSCSLLNMTHLSSAIWHAHNSFQNGHNISNSLSVESLIYISGQRQIRKAIEFFGIDLFVNEIGLIVFHFQPVPQNWYKTQFSEIIPNVQLNSFKFAQSNGEIKKLANHYYKLIKREIPENIDLNKLEQIILSSIAYLSYLK